MDFEVCNYLRGSRHQFLNNEKVAVSFLNNSFFSDSKYLSLVTAETT